MLSAIVSEGHLQYKVDKLSDAVREHYWKVRVEKKQ